MEPVAFFRRDRGEDSGGGEIGRNNCMLLGVFFKVRRICWRAMQQRVLSDGDRMEGGGGCGQSSCRVVVS